MTGAVLAALLAGHLVGDWVVQTDRQAAGKVGSWWWNQAHVGSYHLVLVAAVAPFWWDLRLAVLVAVSWVTHSFIDRRWPVRWLMTRSGSGPFADTGWGPVVVDQALHVSILLLGAAHLLGGRV